MPASISVEVVLAFADRQELVSVRLEHGSTVDDAIERALPPLFPDIDLESLQCGIWGRPVPRTHTVADGDRVELYRPLEIDPRDARRQLAAAGRSMTSESVRGPRLRGRD